MSKEISLNSFKQIKALAKALAYQAKLDEQKNVPTFDDYNFGGLSKTAEKISGDGIETILCNNDDLVVTLNLNVVSNYTDILVYFADADVGYTDSLTVSDLAAMTKKLVKLGRQGIQERVNRNLNIQDKINNLQAQMDLDV